jgi:hypothetical protein
MASPTFSTNYGLLGQLSGTTGEILIEHCNFIEFLEQLIITDEMIFI